MASPHLLDMKNRFQIPTEAALPLCTCSSLDMLQIVQLSPLTRRVKGQLKRSGLGVSLGNVRLASARRDYTLSVTVHHSTGRHGRHHELLFIIKPRNAAMSILINTQTAGSQTSHSAPHTQVFSPPSAISVPRNAPQLSTDIRLTCCHLVK